MVGHSTRGRKTLAHKPAVPLPVSTPGIDPGSLAMGPPCIQQADELKRCVSLTKMAIQCDKCYLKFKLQLASGLKICKGNRTLEET